MEDEPRIVTSIRVPESIWRALRSLAEVTEMPGRRRSVSGVIEHLVQREVDRRKAENERA